jgi:hypothetical protein
MLVSDLVKITGERATNCERCGGDTPEVIAMFGYGGGTRHWCAACAMQLARKILEDLCELKQRGEL